MAETKHLPRDTICALFEIGSPIWNGKAKKRMVGLALNRIRKHNEIHFTYRRKRDGQLSIPDAYYFDGDLLKGLDYEVQSRYGTTLVLIPFSDLQILERSQFTAAEEKAIAVADTIPTPVALPSQEKLL